MLQGQHSPPDGEEPDKLIISDEVARIINELNSSESKSVRRMRSKKKIIIDIMCGKCSLAQYWTTVDPRCTVICIDRRDREDALEHIPQHIRARIRYVQMDAIKLDYATLKDIVWQQCSSQMHEVYHIHASPDCTTLSSAGQTCRDSLKRQGNASTRS